jgi:hypothetical protein
MYFTGKAEESSSGSAIDILQCGAYRTGERRPVARLSQAFAEFELQALAGSASIANVARISAGESMSVGQVRESDLGKSSRNVALQLFIQAAQQHVGPGRGISVHGNDGVAASNEFECTRLVETMAGQVKAVEIVAGRPQAFEKVEPVFIAGNQPRDLGGTPFNPPAVRREHGDSGSFAGHDVHRVVDTFDVVAREIVVAAKVAGGNQFHGYSLPPRGRALRGDAGSHRSAPARNTRRAVS